MKVICDCGAKYAFDAPPEMVRHPMAFACPTCGVDLSARIAALVQEQFGAAPAHVGQAPATEIALPPGVIAPPAETSAPPPPPLRVTMAPAASAPPLQVRMSHGAASAAATAAPDVKDTRFCGKHPQQRVTEKCRVCEKPICPSCMQLFGYVCSPRCKEKADLQGIELPKFAGQRDEVQRKEWRKIGLVVKIATVLILGLLGVWFWYAWFGSRPRVAFAVRFEDAAAMSGRSAVCEGGQIVFIHGAKLARYDLKSKKQVWLRQLVDQKQVEAEAAKEYKEMQEDAAKSEFTFKLPSLDKFTKGMIRRAEGRLELRVHGKNIWVADGKQVQRFDWESGESKQEVAFTENLSAGVLRGDELEFKEQVDAARLNVTRFNLVSGKLQADEIGEKPKSEPANMAALFAAAGVGKGKVKPNAVGPNAAGTARGMNVQQLAAAVANAPLAAKLAAPATISVARNQQAALDAMEEMDGAGARAARGAGDDSGALTESSTLIPTATGFIQMTSRMTERNFIRRTAMKAAPKKSALDGPVNAAATMDIANELLNEMSRNSGAGDVIENHSKYQVKIHRGGGVETPDWEGEVFGEPEFYPQATVNVLAAGTNVYVLDQQNKVKWKTTLLFPLAGGGSYFEVDEAERRGLGPVVERGETLFVYDEGVLSAFDLATGQARWRLPSVGITGMYFDGAGMIYLNTTTASPDKIKYSRQIDVNDSTGDIVLKLDPKNGKEIWKHSMGGKIAYLSGQFIYTLTYTAPRDDDDEVDENLAILGMESKPYIRIRRISPNNGRVLWDHYEPRGALDVKIHNNTFQIVMKKEVQVLKFISF